jgi:hypothetical protein
MKAIVILGITIFLGLGWYVMLTAKVVPGQEWIGYAVMAAYTLMLVTLAIKTR